MHWNIDPVFFEIGHGLGFWPFPLHLRWYGLFFMIGLLLGASALPRYFEERHLPVEHAHSLTLWMPIGMILGAHLIHLIFYEPHAFVDHPRRILEIGSGLASHGGGLGAVLALAIFCRRHGANFHQYADPAMVASIWVFPWVRIGNFFNSEIVGLPTRLPWGVIFDRRHYTEPRHPSQLYEASMAFVLLMFAVWLNRKHAKDLPTGFMFYLLLLLHFTGRFLIEYVKEPQALPASSPLTMGQLLSIPIIVGCAVMLVVRARKPKVDVPLVSGQIF